jgi:hypothetical protein
VNRQTTGKEELINKQSGKVFPIANHLVITLVVRKIRGMQKLELQPDQVSVDGLPDRCRILEKKFISNLIMVIADAFQGLLHILSMIGKVEKTFKGIGHFAHGRNHNRQFTFATKLLYN